jgi:glycosyltransferase involved in cell wall biosynthesis
LFQSDFQRSEIEPLLAEYGYDPASGHLIRGAFDVDGWQFQPRPHARGEAFVVGRAARPDKDKWSSNTWPIYERIQYRNKRALMLGMDERTHEKLGPPPDWADCLRPMALSSHDFFRQLHCTLPVNGGARENWPRAGLEAMAAGVPVVAQDEWGWREMIVHGETGFLGSCDEELAHYAALLAYDEDLRLEIATSARRRLEADLAAADRIWHGWQRLFDFVGSPEPALEEVA